MRQPGQFPNSPTSFSSAYVIIKRVISAAYISFSAFALFFVFVVGSIIVIVSWTIGPCLAWGRRRLRLFEYEELEWCANETFQLQRMAYEALNSGTWSGATDAVPIAKPGEELAILDVTDPSHPRLVPPLTLNPVAAEASTRDSAPAAVDQGSGTSSKNKDHRVSAAAEKDQGAITCKDPLIELKRG